MLVRKTLFPLRGVLASALLSIALAPAFAGQALKQVDGAGRVTYSDQPVAGKRVVETLTFSGISAEERAEIEARRASLARQTEALRERLRERSSRLDHTVKEIQLSSRSLATAHSALENGLAPRPGERTGRRLNDAYFTRLAALEQRVVDANLRLDRLHEERNRLK